jgi:plastocyanin
MAKRALFIAALLVTAFTSSAAAGVIRGVVRIPTGSKATIVPVNAYPGRAGSLAQATPTVRGEPEDAVIWIERIPTAVDSTLSRASEIPQMAQKGQAFVPRVLAVAAGQAVDFPNLDPIFHNVFSVSPVKRFDLGKYPRGQSRRLTFRKSGLVQVYCDIHANMAGFILVLPNHAFTRPDPSGTFELPELPAGTYAVKVWHPDLPEMRRSVEVPETGVAQVDFSY